MAVNSTLNSQILVAETSMVLNSNCDLPIDFDQEYVLSQQAGKSQRGQA